MDDYIILSLFSYEWLHKKQNQLIEISEIIFWNAKQLVVEYL